MKFILALCVTLAVVASVSCHVDFDAIKTVNSNPDSTWTAGPNPVFMGATLDSVKSLLGWKKDLTLENIIKDVEIAATIPTSFDARQMWPQCPSTGVIRNQAECGSCWAFGAVESFTDRYCIAANGTENPAMSAEYIVSCDNGDDGCQGGDAYSAWDFIKEEGLPTNSCQPYDIPTCPPAQQPCLNFKPTPKCVKTDCYGNETGPIPTKYTVSKTFGVPSKVAAIQTEIMTNGPVEACFTVYADFVNYKSGVYQHQTGAALGGHCVKILGWGVSSGTPYWTVANSWTTYWGDQGYFWILQGKNECGIESEVVAGTPILQ
eukprot:TRINITY_DN512_c4_g1_i1.p1 TRINITY_DN512_c4_g1~~TRINITY_DN512_c4_g1_i1.p1  ORF type:complete len:335 (+),score=97.69 TRINITY_DN512_c4_g1_i1:50-1006(+)